MANSAKCAIQLGYQMALIDRTCESLVIKHELNEFISFCNNPWMKTFSFCRVMELYVKESSARPYLITCIFVCKTFAIKLATMQWFISICTTRLMAGYVKYLSDSPYLSIKQDTPATWTKSIAIHACLLIWVICEYFLIIYFSDVSDLASILR